MELGKLATSIELGAGESIIVVVSPAADVTSRQGRQGGTVYSVPVTLENGKQSNLRGGERLIAALQEAIGNDNGPMRLKVKAVGDAGTTARDWSITRA